MQGRTGLAGPASSRAVYLPGKAGEDRPRISVARWGARPGGERGQVGMGPTNRRLFLQQKEVVVLALKRNEVLLDREE
jgi:hypothetical protein